MEQNQYIGYQTILSQITSSADALSTTCAGLGLEQQANDVQEAAARLKNHAFKVAIMGEFKRGKSTVINALLGQEVVPSDVLPCTATVNRIRWDAAPHAEVRFKEESGRGTEQVSVEDLSQYVTKISQECEDVSRLVEEAVVYYPCRFCRDGVEIIDTPGLNDDERMDAISESILPELDAIIMVISADVPFSISEASFVRNHVLTSDLGRIIFVVNKIDAIRARDRVRLLDNIRSKITETITSRIQSVYGADSEQCRQMLAKLGDLQIYPISARDALDGKLDGDDELLAGSGMPQFEQALTRLLTQERGMLELTAPVNTLMSRAKEAIQHCESRIAAIDMDLETFRTKQLDAMRVIDQQRAAKKAEMDQLKQRGDSLYMKLLPEVSSAYDAIRSNMADYIEQLPIDPNAVKNQQSQEKLAKSMEQQLSIRYQQEVSDAVERLQLCLVDHLGETIDSLEQYNKQLTESIGAVQSSFKRNGSRELLIDSAIGSMIIGGTIFDTMLPGIGGLISGYRKAGIGGAVVGGVAGSAAGTIAVSMAITGGLTFLPVVLVGGIVATMFGGAVVDLVFKKKIAEQNVQALRNSLKNAINVSLEEMINHRALENWLKDAASNVISRICTKVNDETETVLLGMQKQLDAMEAVIRSNEQETAAEHDRLSGTMESLGRIVSSLAPIRERMNIALGAQ